MLKKVSTLEPLTEHIKKDDWHFIAQYCSAAKKSIKDPFVENYFKEKYFLLKLVTFVIRNCFELQLSVKKNKSLGYSASGNVKQRIYRDCNFCGEER